MAYLPRDARRTEILEAVIALAEAEGFGGATTRRVAQKVGISAGNVHHLFDSASSLKRAAFELYAERSQQQLDEQNDGLPPMQQLVNYLTATALGETSGSRRLWSSAVDESANDSEFAKIYSASALLLLERTTDLLEIISQGKLSREQAFDAANRLMTFAIGVAASGSASLVTPPQKVLHHISVLINFELANTEERSGEFQRAGEETSSVMRLDP